MIKHCDEDVHVLLSVRYTAGNDIRKVDLLPHSGNRLFYVVDRARVNSTTRYSPEAPAEGLYQVGLLTSALSHLYHGYFFKKEPPLILI